jgi:hypothetical protein
LQALIENARQFMSSRAGGNCLADEIVHGRSEQSSVIKVTANVNGRYNERAQAGSAFDKAKSLEFSVSALDRIGVDCYL